MEHIGRFAPTPSGRMHLGNVFAALIAWLSVKSKNGAMVLRMEDLDTQRTSDAFAQVLRDDLRWLGLTWDLETTQQSKQGAIYDKFLQILQEKGLLYPCYCTRSQLHNVNAPHAADGTYIYDGRCRRLSPEQGAATGRAGALRVIVPEKEYVVQDLCFGQFRQNLATDCGDFVVRRADGVHVYQLAVTVDDGLAGVTEVVRGVDLLGSAPRQMYVQDLLDFSHPAYGHVPLLLAPDGRRLSKRDQDLDLGQIRKRMTPQQLLGLLGYTAGIIDRKDAISLAELTREFDWKKIKKQDVAVDSGIYLAF